MQAHCSVYSNPGACCFCLNAGVHSHAAEWGGGAEEEEAGALVQDLSPPSEPPQQPHLQAADDSPTAPLPSPFRSPMPGVCLRARTCVHACIPGHPNTHVHVLCVEDSTRSPFVQGSAGAGRPQCKLSSAGLVVHGRPICACT